MNTTIYKTGILLAICAFFAKPVSAFTGDKEKNYDVCVQNNAEAALAPAPFAVIEMFTSEGCSSCPPAYKVTQGVVANAETSDQKVYLLDFHVDYWNNLGWTDPYSSKAYSERQGRYSRYFPGAGLYTPQVVVNGKEQMVGSDSEKVTTAVNTVLKSTPTGNITVTAVHTAGDSITVDLKALNLPANTLVNLALVQSEVTNHILKGENEGLTLTHHNVVRLFRTTPISTINNGKPLSLGKYSLPAGQKFSVIAYAQDMKTWNVLAVDSHDLAQ